MSHMTGILKKELRELLTPGSVISVLVMVVLFAGLGGLIGDQVDEATSGELPTFGYIGSTEGDYDGWNVYDTLLSIYGDQSDKIILMDSDGSDRDEVASEMMSKDISAAIAVPNDIYDILSNNESSDAAEKVRVAIQQYYVYTPTGLFDSTVSTSVGSTVVSMLNSSLSQKLISQSGIQDFDYLSSPLVSSGQDIGTVVNGEIHMDVTPSEISSQVSSDTLMIPIVIMIIIMMVGSIVISSMGSEKENKTLETLLTMPIKRTTIVSGKIVAAAIVGLVYGLAYMAGMSIYMGSMTGSIGSGVDLAALGMSLDTLDWALVMVSMFLAIICALGLCMILGAFAKNYKSAQTMTMPLSILAMIPMFIIMFTGWYGAGAGIQAITFAIPFSHPMMAMQALMNGDVTLVLGGIGYMAVFAAATIFVTVWLYKSDILITGLGQNKYIQKLSGRN